MGFKHPEKAALAGTAENHGFGKQAASLPVATTAGNYYYDTKSTTPPPNYGFTLPLQVDVVIYKGDRKGTYKYKAIGVQSKKTVAFCSTRFRSVSAARNHAKSYFNVLTSAYKS